ncbi:MAG: hypothetical protein JO058_10305 [Alphaproteobacteria bacterium]|nr:hypothetical protein [Alphaproteobacteria bacterium]
MLIIPFALTLATLVAISSARVQEPWVGADNDVAVPFWAVLIFVIALGCASFVFGLLNPEITALMGLEGIVGP